MKIKSSPSILSLALTASLLGSAAWSTDSYACAADSYYISAVCIMSSPRLASGFDGYVLADGRTLNVSQYQALFSLIGVTYGGSPQTAFALPDLRGRVVVGADSRNVAYQIGKSGGSASIQLTTSQLPAHAHTLTTPAAPGQPGNVVVTVKTDKLTAATSLSGLTTTTDLAGVPFTSSTSSLSIKASSTGGASGVTPSATSYLGKVGLGSATIYTPTTPDVVMASGSVVGTVSGTLSGTAPGSVSGGTATTTLSGAPTVSIGGATDATGAGTLVPTMPPYLALYYFIATQGLYPVSNN